MDVFLDMYTPIVLINAFLLFSDSYIAKYLDFLPALVCFFIHFFPIKVSPSDHFFGFLRGNA